MKKLLLLAASAALVACSENPTQPENLKLSGPNLTVLTPVGNNLLACFSGSDSPGDTGTCTTTADHKKGFLTNNSATPPDFSGVYSLDQTVYGQRLSDITALSYTYKSTSTPARIPTLDNLRYNIPIDTDGD